MNTLKNLSVRPFYLTLLVFFLIVFFYRPVFAPDFAYLNDYTAFMPLSFGFPESAGVFYLGRPIQAILANIQFRFLGDMLSLQMMRVFIVLMIATAAVLFFRHLQNHLNIHRYSAALLSLLIFTLPSMAINSIHIAQSVPGIVPVFLMLLAHHLMQLRNSVSHNRFQILIAVFALIFISLLTYPPVTFFFLTLTFLKFIFGTKDPTQARLADIFVEVAMLFSACIVYFLFIKYAFKPFFVGSDIEESGAYGFTLSADIFSKVSQAIELFAFNLSAWFPPLNYYFLVPLGLGFILIVTWATVLSPYLKHLRNSTKVILGVVLSTLITIVLTAPIFVIYGDYPILYRVTFASMAATIPVAIVFALDRAFQVDKKKGIAFIVMLIIFSPFIFLAEMASHHRLVLQVKRLTMEYQHVFNTVIRESSNGNNNINGHRIFRVPPVESPPDPSAYLYRDFGYTSVDSSPEAMVRAVIQSIDASNRYSQGNNNMDGFKVSYDPHGPRYEAEISEGITFNREGYPSFISSYTGISGREVWGRWTDSEDAVIEFVQLLPRKFTLKIYAGTFSALVGVPVKIIVGNTQLEAKFNSQEATEVVLSVSTDGNAKSIIFKFPKTKSPMELGLGGDTRHLGLALIKLQIDSK